MKTFLNAAFCLAGLAGGAQAGNFVSPGEDAPPTTPKFGVREIILRGKQPEGNPHDTLVQVTFTPPSGKAKTVYAFCAGPSLWRARVYASEVGSWKWVSKCATAAELNGETGTFRVVNSKLRGRLLPHPHNPRYWMTENGRWFLNLNDTAYFLLSLKDQTGKAISQEDFEAYVRDAVAHGITSFRATRSGDPGGNHLEGGEAYTETMFQDESCTLFRGAYFNFTDIRLRWLLDHYPDVYVQMILLPLGTRWGQDETFWTQMSTVQKERLLRHMVARYAAYPQVYWLVENDAHYDEKHPNNNALAREVGAYLREHDPWQHPISTGPARRLEFPFADEKWASYIHLENGYELDATLTEKYWKFGKPIFLGEDYYEQDRPERDPVHMDYFQRRLFWSWTLSGGMANYGGRWWVLQPYNSTGERPTPSVWDKNITFSKPLNGLKNVRFIRDYFAPRNIELPFFEPDSKLAVALDGATEKTNIKVMRRGRAEFLIYHPNAAADGREAQVSEKTARLRLDLREAKGRFAVGWYRAADGTAQKGQAIAGGRQVELTAPWPGADVVVRLLKQ